MSVSVWWVLAAAMCGTTLGFVLCAALVVSARTDREPLIGTEAPER